MTIDHLLIEFPSYTLRSVLLISPESERIPQLEEVVINVSWLSAQIVKWIASLVWCAYFSTLY